MKLHDASDIKDVDYGCTEYAVKRITGRDLLDETGLEPGKIGFENVDVLTGGQCTIHRGTLKGLVSGSIDGTMLRIRPQGQDALHTVILIEGRKDFPIIEDQHSIRGVPLQELVDEWSATEKSYARCSRGH